MNIYKTDEEIEREDDSNIISPIEQIFIAIVCLLIGGAIAWLVL